MKKYEYDKIFCGYIAIDRLNQLGQEGWKVIHIEYNHNTSKYTIVLIKELDELSEAKESL